MSTTRTDNAQQMASSGAFSTDRKDNWWLGPLATALGLGAFGVYSTWAAFQGVNYEFGPYLSPFYAPLIKTDWFPFSPALLILWAPLGFRATCYYYRKAYYRAFFVDPVACAVGEPRGHNYKGETSFPFIIQNVHRYFMYIAVIFIALLGYDAALGYIFDGKFGVGVGSIIMTINVFLLGSYTFGCHSLRHVIGGKTDCFSCTNFGPTKFAAWKGVSFFNSRHQLFAWCSLFSVGLTDLYIRLCAMGIINDVRLF